MAQETIVADRSAIRGAVSLQCRLTAKLQMEMASVLTGKGQDELRDHFIESSRVLLSAAKELDA